MRKFAVLLTVVALALSSFATSAFGAITEGNGNGNPDCNPAMKIPGGQNKDSAPGAFKEFKCDHT